MDERDEVATALLGCLLAAVLIPWSAWLWLTDRWRR